MKTYVWILFLIMHDGSEDVDRVYTTSDLCHDWGQAMVKDFHLAGHRCDLTQTSSTSVAEATKIGREIRRKLLEEKNKVN